MKCVAETIFLDIVIQRRICHEAGRLVHLDQPRLALVVQENVYAKHLETMGVFYVLGLR